MNEIFDVILYTALFAVQLALLIVGARRPLSVATFVILYAGEISGLTGAISMALRYNDLPGIGAMPGFTYLGAFIFSCCAAIAFALLLIATIIVSIVLFVKRKKGK